MKTKHRILSVLTVLALVASLTAVMVAPAAAEVVPTLILTPNIGPAGTVVTVTGEGFPAEIDGTLTAVPADVIAPVNFRTTADGTIPANTTATILNAAPLGEATFTATVGVGGDAVSDEATFTVTFPLTLSPLEGPPGTGVTVTGVVPGVGAAPGILTATPAGVIAPVHFRTGDGGEIALILEILPGARVGEATFIATVGLVKGTATFEVTVAPEAITLAPTSGVPGTEVTVTGVRFPVNAPGVLSAYPAGVISPVTFTTTAAGAIPATVVTILPDADPGDAIFTARVGVDSDTATFMVIEVPDPTITLNPTAGPRGEDVIVTGLAFPAYAHGIITAPGVITPLPFLTTGVGGFEETVIILGVAPFGLATIIAEVGIDSASAIFVVQPPDAPYIDLSVPAGARGTVVTVSGANFPDIAAGRPGVIMAPGVITPIGFETDGYGVVPPDTDVTILSGAPFGAATITVTVGVVSVDVTFTVRAPEVFVSPTGGVRGAEVTVTGRGFPPAMTIGTITAPGVISPAVFRTDDEGDIIEPLLIVPTILLDAPLGPATFTATVDPPGPPVAVTAEAIYTVGITPTITLTPTIGFEGIDVEVRGHGFPLDTRGTVTAPGVIDLERPTTDGHGRISHTVDGVVSLYHIVDIVIGAPVGLATITVTVGAYSATAEFMVAGVGVPVIVPEPIVPVLEGLADVWDLLGKSVLEFREGNWYRHHTVPEKHELIPEAHRLAELKSGGAYWIYLTEDITDVLIGGVSRTLPAGWHNIGWVL